MARDKGTPKYKFVKLYNSFKASLLKRLVEQGYQDYVLSWEYYKSTLAKKPYKIEVISSGKTDNWMFSADL